MASRRITYVRVQEMKRLVRLIPENCRIFNGTTDAYFVGITKAFEEASAKMLEAREAALLATLRRKVADCRGMSQGHNL